MLSEIFFELISEDWLKRYRLFAWWLYGSEAIVSAFASVAAGVPIGLAYSGVCVLQLIANDRHRRGLPFPEGLRQVFKTVAALFGASLVQAVANMLAMVSLGKILPYPYGFGDPWGQETAAGLFAYFVAGFMFALFTRRRWPLAHVGTVAALSTAFGVIALIQRVRMPVSPWDFTTAIEGLPPWWWLASRAIFNPVLSFVAAVVFVRFFGTEEKDSPQAISPHSLSEL